MPKQVTPLTDTAIKALKSTDKKKADGNNLFIIINQDGTKWWRYDYIRPSGGRNSVSFGEYPTVTLAKARILRDEARQKLNSDVDISVERKKAKKELQRQSDSIVSVVIDKWLNLIEPQVTADYHKRTQALLYNNIIPFIGTKDISLIEPMELVGVLKKKEATGYLDVTQRIWGLCSQVWKFAVANGFAKHNITADIDYKYVFKKHMPKHFEHYTKPQDIKSLLIDIDNYWGGVSVKYCLKLLPYVFVRPSNIRLAKWSDIDLDKCEWRISMSEMKAPKAIKETSKQTFLVPLASQAVELLKELHAINGRSQYVFTSDKIPNEPISDGAINMALKRMGHGIVGHGFRHTATTLMNEFAKQHGFSIDVIESQMAHKDKDKIRGTYNHAQYLDERKKLMQWWADYLDGLKN